jgi:DNA polymerase III subunit beta
VKIRAERGEFVEAIGWATRTVGSRPALPALAGVLLEAEGGRLTCRATDLELSGEISVEVQVEEPGRALLPGRLLAQLAARLPEAPVEVGGDAERLSINCGRATFEVRGMPVEDFPRLGAPAEDAPRGIVPAADLVRLAHQVSRAASADEARPVLTGVWFEGDAGALTAAATDSYRLAVRRMPWNDGVEVSALIPARALAEAAKSAGEVGGDVEIVFEEGRVSFVSSDRRLSTNLVEGTFPNYRQLLPEDHETRVVVDRAELIAALQRVSVVALGQANTPVHLEFATGGVELTAGSQEIGDASESLPAEVDGDDISIAFNPMFLLSGLEAIDVEQVLVELRDGLKPALLRPGGDAEGSEELLYLLMPVRTS